MFGALIGVSITASVASGGTVPITGAAVIGAIKLTALFWGWIYISNKIEMGAEKEKNLKKKIIILTNENDKLKKESAQKDETLNQLEERDHKNNDLFEVLEC